MTCHEAENAYVNNLQPLYSDASAYTKSIIPNNHAGANLLFIFLNSIVLTPSGRVESRHSTPSGILRGGA